MTVFARLRETFHTQAERMRHKPFLRAAMACAALVATADGKVSFSERMEMDRLLDELDALKVYDVHTAVDLFNDHVEALASDREAARKAVFAAASRFADDGEAAQLLLRICRHISQADGDYADSERQAIADLAAVLKLPPPA
jgi:tellurite resistance protein